LYSTLAEALWALGYTQTIAVKTLSPNTYSIGALNPNAPFDGQSPVQFEARYGLSLAATKGNLVGERFAPFVLQDLRDHSSNPLNLSQSFDPYSSLASADAKYIRGRAGNTAAWDTLIIPLYDQLFPVDNPPPPPPPPPDDEPPVDDDPPPPVVVVPPPVINMGVFDLLDKFKLFSRIGLYRLVLLKDAVKFAREYKIWRDEHWDQ